MSKAKSSGITIPPLRTLDDFLLESARFQIPNLGDLEKWGYRVTNNLLYYQTNYFLTALVICTIVCVFHPVKFVSGLLATSLLVLVFCYITSEGTTASQFKRKHPIITVLLILTGGYFVTYMLGSLLVFYFGIFLPIGVIFIHSSLRLRNLKNKLSNQVELMGLKITPMGIFLTAIGMEQEM